MNKIEFGKRNESGAYWQKPEITSAAQKRRQQQQQRKKYSYNISHGDTVFMGHLSLYQS